MAIYQIRRGGVAGHFIVSIRVSSAVVIEDNTPVFARGQTRGKNIMKISDNSGYLSCRATFLKSAGFYLSLLILALFLSSNMAYALDSIISGTASGGGSIAIGNSSTASGSVDIAIGFRASTANKSLDPYAAGGNNIAIGGFAKIKEGFGSALIGAGAEAGADLISIFGYSGRAAGSYDTAIGAFAATGASSSYFPDSSHNTAIGAASIAQSYIGSDSGDYGYATAVGSEAVAAAYQSVALGAHSWAGNVNEVNIGIWNASQTLQTEKRTLSGVADGVQPDHAVNLAQLDKVSQDVKTYTDEKFSNISSAGGISQQEAENIANIAKGAAVTEADGHTDNKIKDLQLDTKLGTADDNARTYASNAQSEARDYTDETAARTLQSANTYTDHRAAQAANAAVVRSNAYTDNRFGELRKNLQHTEKRLNAGIAGVAALSSIPYAAGNKFSYGIGAANYQNGNAVATGVQFRVSPSTSVRLNISWDSAGNNATGVGIAGGW